jgi:hypothetical protein
MLNCIKPAILTHYYSVLKHRAMKTCEGVTIKLHPCLNSALDGVQCLASFSGRLDPRKEMFVPVVQETVRIKNMSARDGEEKNT